MRLCALLRERELCVTDLVRVTGIAQSRVSTHLGAAARGGVRARPARGGAVLLCARRRRPARRRRGPVLRRGGRLGRSHAGGGPAAPARARRRAPRRPARLGASTRSSATTRRGAPGNRWRSGLAALLRLGDVLDVGSGDGAAASVARAVLPLAHLHRHATPRMIEAARERLARLRARARPGRRRSRAAFRDGVFDAVLLFHTLTYAEHPARALAECARVLRPGGRLVLLCLDQAPSSSRSPPATASATQASRPRTVRGLLLARRPDVSSCRGRLPRGEEAPPASRPGHRRQAQTSATKHRDDGTRATIAARPTRSQKLLRNASPSSTARWAPPSAPTA